MISKNMLIPLDTSRCIPKEDQQRVVRTIIAISKSAAS